jgi:glucose/arabinose dehydrogenase
VNRILRYDDIDNRLDNPPAPVVVTDSLPRDTHHGWKFIAFGPDGKLYVPVGAPCNICEPGDPTPASCA